MSIILFFCSFFYWKNFITKLRERLDDETVNLLEELFILDGIFFDPNSVEELESAYEDVISRTITSLQQSEEELSFEVEEVRVKPAFKISIFSCWDSTNTPLPIKRLLIHSISLVSLKCIYQLVLFFFYSLGRRIKLSKTE